MKKLFPVLFVLATLLFTCPRRKTEVAPPAGSLDPEKPTPEIVLRFATYEWEHRRYQELIQTFEADNPGVGVQLISIDEVLGLSNKDRTWPDDAWLRLVYCHTHAIHSPGDV